MTLRSSPSWLRKPGPLMVVVLRPVSGRYRGRLSVHIKVASVTKQKQTLDEIDWNRIWNRVCVWGSSLDHQSSSWRGQQPPGKKKNNKKTHSLSQTERLLVCCFCFCRSSIIREFLIDPWSLEKLVCLVQFLDFRSTRSQCVTSTRFSPRPPAVPPCTVSATVIVCSEYFTAPAWSTWPVLGRTSWFLKNEMEKIK